jgi:serine/threonine-protein kinase
MDELIGKELGPYQIVSRLDEGGMAGVYKAVQPDANLNVALKVLQRTGQQDTFVQRFMQEAKIVARLDHPHIVPVYGFGETGDYLYIALRLIDGGTLGERFHGQPFALSELKQIVTQIGRALDYAHAKGVVHRDIKPKNILLDRHDNALLTDFGVAKDLEDDPRLTRLGHTVGTPTYMSPEQIKGKTLDGRTDIYSLGVVLYQLATGYLPFQGKTMEEICAQHLNEPVPSPHDKNPDLPATLEKVIFTMLAKKPADRYTTAGQMVQALEAATTSPPLSGPHSRDDQLIQPSSVIRKPAVDSPAADTDADPESGKATVISPRSRTRTRSTNPPVSASDNAAQLSDSQSDDDTPIPASEPNASATAPADEADDEKTVHLPASDIDEKLMPGRGRAFTIFLIIVMIVLMIIAVLMVLYVFW